MGKRTKQPTVMDLIKANETTLGVLVRSVDRWATAAGRIESRLETRLTTNQLDQDQINQLATAVNQIAAYAAAMDETKQTMIRLTSRRIEKLEQRLAKLRHRVRRLNGD
jgi:uncharacterized protein (DUF3084 family)